MSILYHNTSGIFAFITSGKFSIPTTSRCTISAVIGPLSNLSALIGCPNRTVNILLGKPLTNPLHLRPLVRPYVGPSVRWSGRPLVRLSVGPSVCQLVFLSVRLCPSVRPFNNSFVRFSLSLHCLILYDMIPNNVPIVIR